MVASYIALYYYAALTNYWAQQGLPPLDKFEETSNYSKAVKRIVDSSYNDFIYLADVLNNIDPGLIQNCSTFHLLQEVADIWEPLIMDSTEAYAKRESNE